MLNFSSETTRNLNMCSLLLFCKQKLAVAGSINSTNRRRPSFLSELTKSFQYYMYIDHLARKSVITIFNSFIAKIIL